MFKKIKGFTLIELLVVITIIGILSTLAVGAVNIARKNAKITKAQHDIDQIYKAISIMANDTDTWPGHQVIDTIGTTTNNEICSDGCVGGIASSTTGITSTDGTYTGWAGPYMNIIPLDPWGNNYYFDTDYEVRSDNSPCDGQIVPPCDTAAVVGSYGPDGIGYNLYNGDDIIKVITK